jgi:hypothetical protein
MPGRRCLLLSVSGFKICDRDILPTGDTPCRDGSRRSSLNYSGPFDRLPLDPPPPATSTLPIHLASAPRTLVAQFAPTIRTPDSANLCKFNLARATFSPQNSSLPLLRPHGHCTALSADPTFISNFLHKRKNEGKERRKQDAGPECNVRYPSYGRAEARVGIMQRCSGSLHNAALHVLPAFPIFFLLCLHRLPTLLFSFFPSSSSFCRANPKAEKTARSKHLDLI